MNKSVLFLTNNFTRYEILTNENQFIVGEVSPTMFYDILALRLEHIYVWQGAAVFALIDNFATKAKLFDYDDMPLDSNNRRLRCDRECISYKDGNGAYYQRKLWLKTAKKNSTDRHKRLTSTSFINFSNFFGGEEFESVSKSFDIDFSKPLYALNELINKFEKFIKVITGLELFKENGNIKYWTIGGISKAYYLKLWSRRYFQELKTTNLLKVYCETQLQDKNFEYDMRLAHLLTPGMLYLKDNKEHKQCFKYDINSLFPFIEQYCPFLGIPIECKEPPAHRETLLDYQYEYIYLYTNLQLKKKEGMPAIFKNPEEIYKGKNKDVIFLDKIAFYYGYHNIILKFYDIVDYTEVKFYKLRKTHDLAIKEYANNLYNLKVGCKLGDVNILHYPVIKYLLNNLHGKFAQLSIVEDYKYTVNDQGIITRQIKKLSDTWSKSHFDYLRGAWIYSYSQAYMLKQLYNIYDNLCKPNNINLEDHIFYIDTDCIITDFEPETINKVIKISDYNLGAFKVEYNFEAFQAYAPKTYAGIIDGQLKVTAAGMKKKEIINYIDKQGIAITDSLIYLSSYPKLPVTILKRTNNGCNYVTEWRPLGKGFTITDEVTEGILYDSDNFTV